MYVIGGKRARGLPSVVTVDLEMLITKNNGMLFVLHESKNRKGEREGNYEVR